MALHVLEAESRELIKNGTSAIVVESDIEQEGQFHMAIRELQHADARHAALAAATKFGIPHARCGRPAAPYPVDENGDTVVRPMDQKVHRYRVEVEVTSKAV